MAAGDDERYLLCAAGAAAVGLPFFCRAALRRWLQAALGVLESVVADCSGMAT